MPHYYLAPYTGSGSDLDAFRPATDVPGWSAIDLRPDASVLSGWCILSLPVRQDPVGALYLGDGLDSASAALRNGLNSRLAVNLDTGSRTVRTALPELLVAHARTDGTRWRPVAPTLADPLTRARRLEIWLGELVWTQPLASGGATYTESFNKADADTLGPDLSWSELAGDWDVLSNQGRIGTASQVAFARASSDSASSDNYAQLSVTALDDTGGGNYPETGPCCRFSSSATTCYLIKRQGYHSGQGGKQWTLRKVVAGSATDIAGPTALALSLPETIRVETSGSTIKGFTGGVERASVTDTAITTGTKGGLYGYTQNLTDAPVSVDSWEFGDLGADPPVVFATASAAWSAGSTTTTPAMPSGWAAGDKLITVIHCKPTSTDTPPTIDTPGGWTKIQDLTQQGTAAQGTDTGATWQAIFERTAVGGDTAPTYTITNGNVCLGLMTRLTKPSGNTWSASVTTSGADTSSGTGFSVTGAADPGLIAGDVVLVLSGIAGNATQSAGSLSATGCTFGSIAETVEGDTNTGTDLAASVWYATVATGPSSAAPAFSATLSLSRIGGATFVRVRSTSGTAHSKTNTDPVGVTELRTQVLAGSRPQTDAVGILDPKTIVTASARASTEPTGVADSVFATLTRPLTEAAGVIDSQTQTSGAARSPIDPIGVTELLDRASVTFLSQIDPVAGTDSRTQATATFKTMTDALEATDLRIQTSGKFYGVTDLADITDLQTQVSAYMRSSTDNLDATDALLRSMTVFVTPTDSVGIADLQTAALQAIRTHTDPVSASDSTIKLLTNLVILVDTLGASDAHLHSTIKFLIETNPVGITELLARAASTVITPTDVLGVIDAQTIAAALARSSTDAVGVIDTHTTGSSISQSKTDAVDATDSHQVTLPVVISLVSALGVTDLTNKVSAFLQTKTEAADVADVAARISQIIRVTVDSQNVLDERQLTVAYTRILTAPVGLTDPSSYRVGQAITVSDPVGASDTMSPLQAYHATLTSPVTASEAITSAQTLARVAIESAIVTDDAVREAAMARFNTEAAQVLDQLVPSRNLVLTLIQLVGVLDAATGQIILPPEDLYIFGEIRAQILEVIYRAVVIESVLSADIIHGRIQGSEG